MTLRNSVLVAQKFVPVQVTHNSSPVETEATSVEQLSVSYLFKVCTYIYIYMYGHGQTQFLPYSIKELLTPSIRGENSSPKESNLCEWA